LFYRYFRPLVDGGYVYIAQPPLYKIQKGKDLRYAFDDNEKYSILRDMGEDVSEDTEIEGEESDGEAEEESTKKSSRVRIQRYKGLGEMDAEELWETTMNPVNRILKQVEVEDAIHADKVFDVLMGNDVPSRKSFIQNNARTANLDI
jgi:DNA gyrase subunit B